MWFVYSEQEQSPDSFNDLVVRVTGKPEALVAQIRAAIRDEDPNLAISEVTTLAEIVDRSFSQEKLLAKLAGFFGDAIDRHFGTALAALAGPTFQPALHGFAMLLIFWFILFWMYRRKIFLRI